MDAALMEDLTSMHRVPLPMIRAAESMMAALGQIGDRRKEERETSVYVGGPLPGACRLCGVDR